MKLKKTKKSTGDSPHQPAHHPPTRWTPLYASDGPPLRRWNAGDGTPFLMSSSTMGPPVRSSTNHTAYPPQCPHPHQQAHKPLHPSWPRRGTPSSRLRNDLQQTLPPSPSLVLIAPIGQHPRKPPSMKVGFFFSFFFQIFLSSYYL